MKSNTPISQILKKYICTYNPLSYLMNYPRIFPREHLAVMMWKCKKTVFFLLSCKSFKYFPCWCTFMYKVFVSSGQDHSNIFFEPSWRIFFWNSLCNFSLANFLLNIDDSKWWITNSFCLAPNLAAMFTAIVSFFGT